jgi:hypothetical protein
MVVPPLSSGRTIMQINGHRALLTSASIALATASMVSILLGMLGFYLVSNTIRRDALTRTGYVIAAMPVTNLEYLVGKYLGNVAFLGLVVLGCIMNVMVMHLLRAEGPLEPLVYLATYAGAVGPAVCVVSAWALMFESIRPLSGRAGDVLYFFIWIMMLMVTAGAADAHTLRWNHYVDAIGMLFMITQASSGGTIKSVQIGGSPYDPSQAPFAFQGIHWTPEVVASRITSAMIALPILALALLFFARFDPAKMKSEVAHAKRNLYAQLNRALKPLTRILLGALSPAGGAPGTVARIGRSEFTLTFMLSPVALALMIAFALWGALAPMNTVLSAVLPLSFLGIVIATADIATRDAAAGMTALLFSMPGVKQRYVISKWIAACATALAFVLVPMLRLAAVQPFAALSLIIGAIFVASLAVSFGTLTGSGKAFTGFFLLFLYMVMSAKGSPGLDFAGWNGVATNAVRVTYLVLSAALVALAAARQRVLQRA